jgi:glycosyltransferase involved in cell wall biosynthesis
MKLSIIIPAYNAEEFIGCCLESCYSQDIDAADYEIIVVDDGSKDHTAQIVSDLALKYPQTRLVSQENQGNGAARNTGILHAKGTYTYFLDADDYIAKNTLGTLLSLLEENNLDILGFASKNVHTSDSVFSMNTKNTSKMDPVLNGIDFLGTYNYKAEVWWYIVKKTFYLESGAFFYDRKFVQDSYFTPTLFSKAQRTAYFDFDVHRYRKSNNSITRNTSEAHLNKHFKDLSFSIQKLYDLRHSLLKQGVTNEMALRRLHAKQQRYVFIIIVRFMRSQLNISLLKGMLTDFSKLEAYPMDQFMTIPDYRSVPYQVLTFIFNRQSLLNATIKIYRMLKG